MAHRGKRKFICIECDEATYFSTKERNSRFRLRCRWCGSSAIEPSPDSKVNDEILREGEVRNDPNFKKFTKPGV